MTTLYFGVEIGGTKLVCAVGSGPDDIREQARIPTADPSSTLTRAIEFFADAARRHGLPTAMGVAAFGPVELRREHPEYGRVTSTPKPGWSGVDLVGPFSEAFGVPIGFDTDVNGAVLGEFRWGAGRGLSNLVYLTVGTGIGGGAIVNGQLLHGLVHPEMGHVSVPRVASDAFPGRCPFHGDCLEGMAAGPAIEERWGKRPEALGTDIGAAVDLEATYLAEGLRQLVYVLAPERIVIGGGVSKLPDLLDAVRSHMRSTMAGYAAKEHQRADFVVLPVLGDDAATAGAFALAEAAVSAED